MLLLAGLPKADIIGQKRTGFGWIAGIWVTLKSMVAILLILLAVSVIAYLYISKVAAGSGTGALPEGYTLIEANGYSFSVKKRGREQAPPVILLHGFPESSVMWEKLTADLNEIGYYTIAPDQRGYSFGARPEAIKEYELALLAEDVLSIADSLGIHQFHLIGHDWGSVVGWQVAADHPERLLSYTSLSVPHLTAFSRAYREDSLQFEASRYVRNFQTQIIPEFLLARNNYQMLRSVWREHREEEINAYLDLFRRENALTSAINWYRANYKLIAEGKDIGLIKVPVLFIWGKNDFALLRSGADWTKDYVENYYRFVELNASHWLIQESYEEVFSEITSHLKKF
jgi:pimeloyl-ACP methyl ester carboxylesterase